MLGCIWDDYPSCNICHQLNTFGEKLGCVMLTSIFFN